MNNDERDPSETGGQGNDGSGGNGGEAEEQTSSGSGSHLDDSTDIEHDLREADTGERRDQRER